MAIPEGKSAPVLTRSLLLTKEFLPPFLIDTAPSTNEVPAEKQVNTPTSSTPPACGAFLQGNQGGHLKYD